MYFDLNQLQLFILPLPFCSAPAPWSKDEWGHFSSVKGHITLDGIRQGPHVSSGLGKKRQYYSGCVFQNKDSLASVLTVAKIKEETSRKEQMLIGWKNGAALGGTRGCIKSNECKAVRCGL